MLISILITVQYLQNVDFSFEEDSNSQNNSSSESCHPHLLSLDNPLGRFQISPLGGNSAPQVP